MLDRGPKRVDEPDWTGHWIRGAVVGAIAYGVGFLATWSLIEADDGISVGEETMDRVGVVFHNAHFADSYYYVDFVIDVSPAAETATVLPAIGGRAAANYRSSVVPLYEWGPELPVALYHGVPVVVLVAGGVAVARLAGSDDVVPWVAGSTVVAGYAPLALIALDSVTVNGYETGLVLDRPGTVVVVAVTYPLLFGAVGGALAHGRQSLGRVHERFLAELPGKRAVALGAASALMTGGAVVLVLAATTGFDAADSDFAWFELVAFANVLGELSVGDDLSGSTRALLAFGTPVATGGILGYWALDGADSARKGDAVRDSVAAGGAVAFGTFPVAVAGGLTYVHRVDPQIPTVLVRQVLAWGLVVPAICGALGGYVVTFLAGPNVLRLPVVGTHPAVPFWIRNDGSGSRDVTVFIDDGRGEEPLEWSFEVDGSATTKLWTALEPEERTCEVRVALDGTAVASADVPVGPDSETRSAAVVVTGDESARIDRRTA